MSAGDHPGLLPMEAALERLLALADASRIDESEPVSLSDADGRILAEPLIATLDLPPWPNSAMDGYALRLADWSGQPLPVSQRIQAGNAPLPLQPGSCARIFTGAPLPEGAELVEQSLALAKLANEFSRKQNLQARATRHKYITASTREYAYAQYMNKWVRKVERVGNANYPQQALLNRLSGQLILTVAIRRDGRIEDITVVKSSGNRVLDRAAGDIVRLAEPFPALPKTAEDPSLLYITRTWQFIAGQTSLN